MGMIIKGRRREAGAVMFGASSSEAVRAFSARSCALLDAIETTVTGLARNTELFRLMAGHARDITTELSRNGADAWTDSNGELPAKLFECANTFKRLHEDALTCLAAARKAPELKADDGVAAAWEDYADSVANLFNATEDLRDTVETIEALKSPLTGKTYGDANELIADLLRS